MLRYVLVLCSFENVSSVRIIGFTHCVSTIASSLQLAAQRFVNYWQGRFEVFGPQKFTLEMTLSEALCDDLTALETGFYCLLPKKDLSGRQILYLEPRRHTGTGYTSESLVSATVSYIV